MYLHFTNLQPSQLSSIKDILGVCIILYMYVCLLLRKNICEQSVILVVIFPHSFITYIFMHLEKVLLKLIYSLHCIWYVHTYVCMWLLSFSKLLLHVMLHVLLYLIGCTTLQLQNFERV